MGHIKNYAEVQKALRKLQSKGNRVARKSTRAVADEVQKVERVLLNLQSHTAGTVTPSQPGQPPARISGHLTESIRVKGPIGSTSSGYQSWVGPTAVYGRVQEMGGVCGAGHRTVLPPRPALKPAWYLTRPRVGKLIADTWESE